MNVRRRETAPEEQHNSLHTRLPQRLEIPLPIRDTKLATQLPQAHKQAVIAFQPLAHPPLELPVRGLGALLHLRELDLQRPGQIINLQPRLASAPQPRIDYPFPKQTAVGQIGRHCQNKRNEPSKTAKREREEKGDRSGNTPFPSPPSPHPQHHGPS